MEKLITKIEQILNQFFVEEQNNRLSQFAMLALKEMILNEIKNYKPVESEVKRENVKEQNIIWIIANHNYGAGF